ncbi:TadE/TadG family type IV pilus assembly protein [Streptomyces prasinus]|uniref:TadE/TadG family type IV pilus assembly protein n=1 Tax=Streptomyces prasinus TaxID=67345 RepID=UPI0036811FA2
MTYDERRDDRGRDDLRRGGPTRSDRGRDEPTRTGGRAGEERTRHRDRGQVAIEYLGFLPVLIIVAMAAVQLGLIAYTAQQAGTAARAGARSASLDKAAGPACTVAVSSWLAGRTECGEPGGGDVVTVTATIDIPSIVPGWNFGPARKSATMPVDH